MATIAYRPDGSIVTGSKAKEALANGTASVANSVKTPRTNEQSKASAERNTQLGFGTTTTVPGTNTASYTSNTKPNVINYTTTASSPVQNTSFLENEKTQNKADATDTLGDINAASKTLYDSVLNYDITKDPAIMKAQAEIDRLSSSFGTTTTDEQRRIDQAGETAGAEFDPIIRDAEFARRQGMPKATIGAGERGGFMNSQFSGAAALVPTEGGTFLGEGGELNRIKSDYDRNIDDLKSKRVMAINAARQAAEVAIRTGKSEDLSRLVKLKEQAMQMSQMVNDANAKKIETINNFEKTKQARIERDVTALETIAKVGGEVPDNVRASVESFYGPGFVDDYFTIIKAQTEDANEKKKVEAADKLTQTLARVPSNQSIKIGDFSYSGYKEVDPKLGIYSFTETDNAGNLTQITTKFNPATNKMEVVGQVTIPGVGKTKTSSGGGNETSDDKEIAAFRKDASETIIKLGSGDLQWGEAFDSLKVKYPQASAELINETLGGGIPYNPQTGFDSSAAWGRAAQ